MGESFMWIFALLILLFGGNFGFGFGNNGAAAAAMAAERGVSQAEFQAGLNNVQVQGQLSQLGLATEKNNYETALLINQLGNNITQQNQANLVNAIQGFNVIGNKLDNLGSQMEKCCCEIKTQMLQDKYERTQFELTEARNALNNAEQTQKILGSIGRFVPWAGSGTPAAAAATVGT